MVLSIKHNVVKYYKELMGFNFLLSSPYSTYAVKQQAS